MSPRKEAAGKPSSEGPQTTSGPVETREIPRPLRLVLFDNDGTLSDSVVICKRASNAALRDAGFPEVDLPAVIAGMRLETVLRMMEHCGTKDRNLGRSLSNSFYRYAEEIADETILFPGVKTLLDRIASAGIAMGLVSNNQSDVVTRVMKANGVARHFPVIIGEDTAEETKPGPGGLLQACRAYGVPPTEAVYVGDGPSDPKAARAAGMFSIGVEWNIQDSIGVAGLGFSTLVKTPSDLAELLLEGHFSGA